jgi:hypothetical protein
MVAMLAFALALGGMLVATPPLYPAYAEQSVRLFGISPALDQRLAGLVMIGEQVASLASVSADVTNPRAQIYAFF